MVLKMVGEGVHLCFVEPNSLGQAATLGSSKQCLYNQARSLFTNCRLQYQMDSKAASSCMVGMKGENECL